MAEVFPARPSPAGPKSQYIGARLSARATKSLTGISAVYKVLVDLCFRTPTALGVGAVGPTLVKKYLRNEISHVRGNEMGILWS